MTTDGHVRALDAQLSEIVRRTRARLAELEPDWRLYREAAEALRGVPRYRGPHSAVPSFRDFVLGVLDDKFRAR